MKGTREYRIWDGIKKRCLSKTAINYRDYGGRGIKICKKWLRFEGFFEDMGYSNGLCIDRIDNNKGYNKKNCRWVTHKQNNNNKSNNIRYKDKTMAEWASYAGISRELLWYRVNIAKWPMEDAIFRPVGISFSHKVSRD